MLTLKGISFICVSFKFLGESKRSLAKPLCSLWAKAKFLEGMQTYCERTKKALNYFSQWWEKSNSMLFSFTHKSLVFHRETKCKICGERICERMNYELYLTVIEKQWVQCYFCSLAKPLRSQEKLCILGWRICEDHKTFAREQKKHWKIIKHWITFCIPPINLALAHTDLKG